ncbi:MAG: hypothetical protein CM1200mP28_02530 [Deltaproteobacteria bacterium]|nr:MAG: hypothetical protein CM1200mP28_02530 [Deltaproteobacteria bacterium]
MVGRMKIRRFIFSNWSFLLGKTSHQRQISKSGYLARLRANFSFINPPRTMISPSSAITEVLMVLLKIVIASTPGLTTSLDSWAISSRILFLH